MSTKKISNFAIVLTMGTECKYQKLLTDINAL